MPNTESKKTIESLCPEVDREVIQDFFARMDEDYFSTFSPEEISKHIALSCKLDPEHRIRVRITPDASVQGEFSIVIVGFDYLAEFFEVRPKSIHIMRGEKAREKTVQIIGRSEDELKRVMENIP